MTSQIRKTWRNALVAAASFTLALFATLPPAAAQTFVRIQNVGTAQFLDAYLTPENDYNVVTRPRQDDNSQLWRMTPVQGDIYTFQQVVSNRYLDAYQTNEYFVVTRAEQGDQTQQWRVSDTGDGALIIQQVSTGRYLYATGHDVYDFLVQTVDDAFRTQHGNENAEWRLVTVQEVPPNRQLPDAPVADLPRGPAGPPPAPTVHSSGTFGLRAGENINLDNGELNIAGADLQLNAPAFGEPALTPLNGAQFSFGGRIQRDAAGCGAALYSGAPLPFSSLSVGDYVCVRTDEARISEFRIDSLRPVFRTINGAYTTWQ